MGEFGEEEGIDIRGDFDGSKGRCAVEAGGQLRSQWAGPAGPAIHF